MTAVLNNTRTSDSPLRAGVDKMVAARRPAERDLTEIDSLLDLSSGLFIWLAGANVIMQLANPGVGYGVLESRVETGRADRHPVKRARTTGLYLAVATIGNDDDKKFMHDEVKKIHDRVFSLSDSPVRYSANSRELQLWVALCLMRFFIDQYELLYRELNDAEREHVLQLGKPLATVLNVPDSDWPTSWAEYEEYFAAGMADSTIDAPVRQMLDELCAFEIFNGKFRGAGDLVQRAVGPTHHSFTRFGVPAETREQMQWEITPADLRRKRRIAGLAKVADKIVPMPLKKVYTIALWDMRLRRKFGIDVF